MCDLRDRQNVMMVVVYVEQIRKRRVSRLEIDVVVVNIIMIIIKRCSLSCSCGRPLNLRRQNPLNLHIGATDRQEWE